MPQHIANKLFDTFARLPKDFNIATCDAKNLFLFLFNVWAVLIARAPDGVRNLAASQDEILWTGLLEHIGALAAMRANEKKLNLLSLVGLLEFPLSFPKKS